MQKMGQVHHEPEVRQPRSYYTASEHGMDLWTNLQGVVRCLDGDFVDASLLQNGLLEENSWASRG